MIILDCENYSSTMESLSTIYDVNIHKIDQFFKSFDIDYHYEISDPDRMGDQELRIVFEETFQLQPKKLDKVCWFHLTRTLPEENFSEGILPLSKSLIKVWDIFFDVFTGTKYYNNLKTIMNSGVNDFQYIHKVGIDSLAGPFAMLVKDVAFDSQSIGHHDYLRIPEIMEDICNGYQQRFGASIIDILEKALKPKIVKFSSDKKIGVSCIEAALYYAYRISNNQSLSLNTNTCFDGNNMAIPYNNILKVELIDA